jgi:hypothetical protein
VLAAFNGLGILDGHTRAWLPGKSSPLALSANQELVKPGTVPSDLPAAEIVVDQRIRQKLARQEPPLAAALRAMDQALDSHTYSTPAQSGVMQGFLNNLPVGISQVRFMHLWSDGEKEITLLISSSVSTAYNS